MFFQRYADGLETVEGVFVKHIYTSTKMHNYFNGHRSIAQPFGGHNAVIAIGKQCFVFNNGKFKRANAMLTCIVCYFFNIVSFDKRQVGHRSFISPEFAIRPKYINGDFGQSLVNHSIVPPSTVLYIRPNAIPNGDKPCFI